jgi:hypothetical protein
MKRAVPTTSSDLLDTLIGKTPYELGKKARTITEMQTPTNQGMITYTLSNFIVSQKKSGDNPYYDQALFFKQQYESNTCYLCGFPIEKGMVEELEHILPIGEALALTGIVQKPKKEMVQTFQTIYNTPEALSYLIEYARSHRCCNQTKGVSSFLSYNRNTSSAERYKIDGNTVSHFLKNVWLNAKPGASRWQEPGACANKSFRNYFSKISMDTFIKNRKKIIMDHYLNPILNFIYKNVKKAPTPDFAELVFLSNQAMSIDQNIWKSVGIRWGGETQTPIEIENTLYFYSKGLSYKKTRDTVLEQILKLAQKNPSLNQKMVDYYNSKKEGRTSRTIDPSSLKRFINVDFLEIKRIHIEYLKNKMIFDKMMIEENMDNEGLLGYEYIYHLIESQNKNLKLFTSMVSSFEKMLLNINNYTTLYLYLYIVYFNPFKYPKKPNFPNEIELNELNDFANTNVQLLGYGPIHDDFVLNVFSNLNYVSNIDHYTNIQQLNSYTNYIALSPLVLNVANGLIDLKNEYDAAAAILELGPKYNDYMMEMEATKVLSNLKGNEEEMETDSLMAPDIKSKKENKSAYEKTLSPSSKKAKSVSSKKISSIVKSNSLPSKLVSSRSLTARSSIAFGRKNKSIKSYDERSKKTNITRKQK